MNDFRHIENNHFLLRPAYASCLSLSRIYCARRTNAEASQTVQSHHPAGQSSVFKSIPRLARLASHMTTLPPLKTRPSLAPGLDSAALGWSQS